MKPLRINSNPQVRKAIAELVLRLRGRAPDVVSALYPNSSPSLRKAPECLRTTRGLIERPTTERESRGYYESASLGDAIRFLKELEAEYSVPISEEDVRIETYTEEDYDGWTTQYGIIKAIVPMTDEQWLQHLINIDQRVKPATDLCSERDAALAKLSDRERQLLGL